LGFVHASLTAANYRARPAAITLDLHQSTCHPCNDPSSLSSPQCLTRPTAGHINQGRVGSGSRGAGSRAQEFTWRSRRDWAAVECCSHGYTSDQ